MSAAAMNDGTTLDVMCSLALGAGMHIMNFFGRKIEPVIKSDGSPVTAVDISAESIILSGLKKFGGRHVCVAEELVSAGTPIPELGREFFLIDALDGTTEFLNNRPDFTVNIALIRDGVPVMGVVFAPAHRELYVGSTSGAFRTRFNDKMLKLEVQAICVSARSVPAKIVVSRSHRSAETDAYIQRCKHAEIKSIGSSLKFCLVASGEADIYPCLGRTMEWDTAAGHAVLVAAGGEVCTSEHGSLLYGKKNQADAAFANPWFLASGAGILQTPLVMSLKG
jgi:3'(2'), 5'-bisphosphate nucleotidase